MSTKKEIDRQASLVKSDRSISKKREDNTLLLLLATLAAKGVFSTDVFHSLPTKTAAFFLVGHAYLPL